MLNGETKSTAILTAMKHLLTYLILVSLCLSRGECRGGKSLKRHDIVINYVNLVENRFRRLQSFILSTLQVSELTDCVFHCLVNESCFSLNFGREAAGNDKRHPCELLSGDIFREADNLVAQSDFHHYSIKVHVACFVFLASTLWNIEICSYLRKRFSPRY